MRARRTYFKKIVSVLGVILGTASVSPVWDSNRNIASTDLESNHSAIRELNPHQEVRSRFLSNSNLYHSTAGPEQYEWVLSDPSHKVPADLNMTPGIRPSVEFWLRVYTEWSTQQVVLFDRRHPEIVYDVFDFSDLAQTSRNEMAYQIAAQHRIAAGLAKYRAGFSKLMRTHTTVVSSHTGATERKILEAIHRSPHRHPLNFYLQNMKLQRGQRDNVIKGLYSAETYFPVMERIFSDLGVPKEATRLSLLESSFNPRAVSRVGATGVWQFLDRSGREFLLIDNRRNIDERLSPIKSSVAAARLLRRNHTILGNWPMAIISYNNGLRSLLKIPRRVRVSPKGMDVMIPCGKSSPLGFASRSYYVEFLALLYAESYRKVFYGDPPTKRMGSVELYRVTKAESAQTIALRRGISLYDLRLYNPDVSKLGAPLPLNFYLVFPSESDQIEILTGKWRISKLPRSPRHRLRVASNS